MLFFISEITELFWKFTGAARQQICYLGKKLYRHFSAWKRLTGTTNLGTLPKETGTQFASSSFLFYFLPGASAYIPDQSRVQPDNYYTISEYCIDSGTTPPENRLRKLLFPLYKYMLCDCKDETEVARSHFRFIFIYFTHDSFPNAPDCTMEAFFKITRGSSLQQTNNTTTCLGQACQEILLFSHSVLRDFMEPNIPLLIGSKVLSMLHRKHFKWNKQPQTT